MADRFDVSGQRVLVVGAARSGIAAARLLHSRGARVTLTDVKSDVPAAEALRGEGVTLELGGHDERRFAHAELIVTSPGVPNDRPELACARKAGVPVIGEIELASRWLRGRLIAITGTKGKSTTTTLVGRMLEAAGRHVLVGGNIGVPLSAQVTESRDDTVHVVEVSSFQLEDTDTFHPWIAALLNLSPDHLDRHASESSYVEAKARIFLNQNEQDWAVVNAESAAALRLVERTRAAVVQYSVEETAHSAVFAARGAIWHRSSEGDVPLAPLSAVGVAGRHTLSNILAASAISRIAGASAEAVTRTLGAFTGLEHVMEPAGAIGDVRFVNDSKATNVDAAARSIESFDHVVAIIGGRYKGGRLEDLQGPLATHGTAVIAFGEARERVRNALEGTVPVEDADTLGEAVRRAWTLAQPSGVVLLAPACASFDMFIDYADRGRRFKEEVRRLAQTPPGEP